MLTLEKSGMVARVLPPHPGGPGPTDPNDPDPIVPEPTIIPDPFPDPTMPEPSPHGPPLIPQVPNPDSDQ
jgi:hypothetical protein